MYIVNTLEDGKRRATIVGRIGGVIEYPNTLGVSIDVSLDPSNRDWKEVVFNKEKSETVRKICNVGDMIAVYSLVDTVKRSGRDITRHYGLLFRVIHRQTNNNNIRRAEVNNLQNRPSQPRRENIQVPVTEYREPELEIASALPSSEVNPKVASAELQDQPTQLTEEVANAHILTSEPKSFEHFMATNAIGSSHVVHLPSSVEEEESLTNIL